MPDSSINQRWDVLFLGHVQGVGFRYTTQSIAGRYAVAGFVRNLPDGGVQLIAEGSSGELTALLEDLQAAMGGYIRETKIDRRPATGEFHAFEIRR